MSTSYRVNLLFFRIAIATTLILGVWTGTSRVPAMADTPPLPDQEQPGVIDTDAQKLDVEDPNTLTDVADLLDLLADEFRGEKASVADDIQADNQVSTFLNTFDVEDLNN